MPARFAPLQQDHQHGVLRTAQCARPKEPYLKRRTRLMTTASIPAAALAAALCFAPTYASARPADGPRPQVTTFHLGLSTRQKVPTARAGGSPPRVTAVVVRAGDTLSQIAAQHRTTWEALAGWNHLADPNMIMPGSRLVLPPVGYVPPHLVVAAPRQAESAATWHPAVVAARTGTGAYNAPAAGNVGGTFGACVRQRENTNSYAWGTGDGGGAYQFEPSTWVAYGGSPGSYGNASPAEQDAVFQNALNRGGQGAWSQFDGC